MNCNERELSTIGVLPVIFNSQTYYPTGYERCVNGKWIAEYVNPETDELYYGEKRYDYKQFRH